MRTWRGCKAAAATADGACSLHLGLYSVVDDGDGTEQQQRTEPVGTWSAGGATGAKAAAAMQRRRVWSRPRNLSGDSVVPYDGDGAEWQQRTGRAAWIPSKRVEVESDADGGTGILFFPVVPNLA